MSNHRNLIDVIDKIIAITPESETKFLYDLEECRKKIWYLPPELLENYWINVFDILYCNVFDENFFDKDSWMEDARKVWIGEDL